MSITVCVTNFIRIILYLKRQLEYSKLLTNNNFTISNEGNIRASKERSKTEGTPKLRLKGNQDTFLRPKANEDGSQPNSSLDTETDNQPRPTTRLSKLLSKSLSSEKSLSSSAKEDDKISEEQPTVVTFDKRNSANEFLKDFQDDEGKLL